MSCYYARKGSPESHIGPDCGMELSDHELLSNLSGGVRAHREGSTLFVFDLDGTLISSYMENPGREYEWWEVLPGRRERLAALRTAGHAIAVATNQAGVAFGFVTEKQVRAKIAAALAALELPPTTPVAVSFAHKRGSIVTYRDPAEIARRKPSGAMIHELMAQMGYEPAETVFVGDRSEDKQAAADAGVRFMWADEFFNADVSMSVEEI